MGCEFVTCGCLSSGEAGVEAAGVFVGGKDCEDVTCGCLSSEEAAREAAGIVSGWLVGSEELVVTCGCLS
jgi:hypothetical protein